MKRKIAIGASIFLGFLALVTTRVVCSARQEYLKAESALWSVKIDVAITHYRRAARWYAPGNPYVTRAMDRLWDLGRKAEDKGDLITALKCYRSIRGAILGARSFYTPHKDRLDPVNRRIARLMAVQQTELETRRVAQAPPKTTPSVDPVKRRAKLEKWHLAQLRRSTAPSVAWSVLAVLGFILWVGSAFAFAYRAISSDDRLQPKPALIWGGAIVAGLAMWMVSLALA